MNNNNHVHGAPDSEEEWLDMLLGRGAGDPDIGIPPWEQEAPKAQGQNKSTTLAPTSPISTITMKQNYIGVKEQNL